METPAQMVRFKAYKRNEAPPDVDRRSTRVKNRNQLPLGTWAKWLVESILLKLWTYTRCFIAKLCTVKPTYLKDHLSVVTTVGWLVVHFSYSKASLYKTTCLQRPQLLRPLSGCYRQVLLYCTVV